MFGTDYERLMDKYKRKDTGVFYTPETVIDYILNQTVAEADLVRNPYPKILDPACGCGYFLLRAYDLLYSMFAAKLPKLRATYASTEYNKTNNGVRKMVDGTEYWREENLPYHIVSCCLYGADTDEEAVKIAGISLTSRAGDNLLKPNIAICDSLIRWENEPVDVSGQELVHRIWSQQYDYIIGNPPYVSYGLRGVKRIDGSRQQHLITDYPNSAEYKISLYALFFERGAEVLRPNGKLAYITPDSFLGGKYFSRLRHYLTNLMINSITLLEFEVFHDAAVGKAVVTVVTNVKPDNHHVTVAAVASAGELKTGSFRRRFQYSQDYFRPRFHLFFSQDELHIFHLMQSHEKNFADFCSFYSGCIARFGQNSIISGIEATSHSIYDRTGELVLCDDEAEKRWRKLLGRGACISQYAKQPGGQYIYIHEDEDIRKLYAKSGFSLDKYTGEKLLLRQTGGDLIAAYDDEGYFCLNNMHIVYGAGEKMPIKVLLGLLNSYLYNYYYHCISRENNRVLPQIDLDVIRRLPVLSNVDTGYVSQLVDVLLSEYSRLNTSAEKRKTRNDIRQVRTALEEYLLEAAGLDSRYKKKVMEYGGKHFKWHLP